MELFLLSAFWLKPEMKTINGKPLPPQSHRDLLYTRSKVATPTFHLQAMEKEMISCC